MHSVIVFMFSVFLLCCVDYSRGMSCKDENNRDVDWYILYKLPKIDGEPKGSDLSDGKAYVYLTSKNPTKWVLSSRTIESPLSMLGLTWQEYDKKRRREDNAYIFYNDDPPETISGSAIGHMKGMVAFDSKSGFWLTHSIPRFGEMGEFEYPATALTNGQSALCVTFPTPALNEICNHLIYCNPNIYQYGISKSLLQSLDKPGKTLFTPKPSFIRKAPFEYKAVIESLGNEKFYSFAKDNQLPVDLYSDILAPSLNTSMIAETWRRGAGTFLPPSCLTSHTVIDVISVAIAPANRDGDISFKSTEDHSKWAIGLDGALAPWVCIGDLNRMASQARRGGGALCFKSKAVWKAYRGTVVDTGVCPD